MKRIDNDVLNHEFKNLYLIYGEEDYLKRQYRDKLMKAVGNPEDEMNFFRYSNTGFNLEEMIEQASTMPFFADYRVIVCENLGFGKKLPEDLSRFLEAIPDTTVMIFVEKEADKRGKLYKFAKEAGRDIEISMPDERTLTTWVGNILKSNGKQMKKEAFFKFLTMTNASMENMEKELEKLISYVGDRSQIEPEDVASVCITQVETKIFDMLNALSAKDVAKTMDLYADMLSAKEPPMKILYGIVRTFRQMKLVKELSRRGENAASIAKKAKMPDFAVRRTIGLANNFSDESIENLLIDAADFERKFKSGLLDEKLAVELLMIKYME